MGRRWHEREAELQEVNLEWWRVIVVGSIKRDTRVIMKRPWDSLRPLILF